MTRTITKTIYNYDELSPAAQAKARERYLEHGLDYEWYDSVYDDAKTVGALMGIEIEKIYFSGFWSQGDGACFEGTFSYKKGAVKAVKEYAPQDSILHAIAQDWYLLQKENFYRLAGTVKQQGHYNHSQCTRVTAYCENKTKGGTYYEFSTDDSYVRDNHEAGAEATRILRRFMDWIYRQLEQDYDYLTSDESIAETARANEWEYDENGVMI